MKILHLGSVMVLSAVLAEATAAPMPMTIQVEDKAIVPVLKIETIRRMTGEAPVRQVEATVFEITNQGRDIVARDIQLSDGQSEFSEAQLAIPVIQQGGVIVPTSKIELQTTLKQDGEIFSKTKNIDAAGVELKKDGTVVQRQLQLGQVENVGTQQRSTHVVLHEDGQVTKDMVIIEDQKDIAQ